MTECYHWPILLVLYFYLSYVEIISKLNKKVAWDVGGKVPTLPWEGGASWVLKAWWELALNWVWGARKGDAGAQGQGLCEQAL